MKYVAKIGKTASMGSERVRVWVDFTGLDDAGNTVDTQERVYVVGSSDDLEVSLRGRIDAELKSLVQSQDVTSRINAMKNVEFKADPPIFPTKFKEMSQLEQSLALMKDQIKPVAIQFIKENQGCTQEELLVDVSAKLTPLHGRLTEVLIYLYYAGAYEKSLIPESSFVALRDFIFATPIEELAII